MTNPGKNPAILKSESIDSRTIKKLIATGERGNYEEQKQVILADDGEKIKAFQNPFDDRSQIRFFFVGKDKAHPDRCA